MIKFIVKEFSKIIQKWFFKQPSTQSFMGMSATPQANTNQLLLNLLLNKENAVRHQQQEFLVQSLLQQANSNILLEMLDQFKHLSGTSTPISMTPVVPAAYIRKPETKENLDDVKSPERDDQEIKDEVNTVQSSEGKTERKVSTLEEKNQGKKISLEEAYSIVNRNAYLQSLFKNFSSLK